jgi:hypothetical protein
MSASDVSADCSPVATNSNLLPYIYKTLDGNNFTDENLALAANPCGLIARSVFTDKFMMFGPFKSTDV